MINSLHRGGTHLLAFAPARWSLFGSGLAVVLAEARVHVALNVGGVLENVVNDAFLDGPPEEVQLAHRGLLDGRLPADLERDALTATEGVEETLAVRLELALVLEVDDELAAVQSVPDVVLFGVVRDEPLDDAEADGRRARQKGHDGLDTPGLVVEILQPADDEILLALDATLERASGRSSDRGSCSFHTWWLRCVGGFRCAR